MNCDKFYFVFVYIWSQMRSNILKFMIKFDVILVFFIQKFVKVLYKV